MCFLAASSSSSATAAIAMAEQDPSVAADSLFPSPSSSIAHLPLDITAKILSLLPLSSKLACKCVCKTWFAIAAADPLLCYTSNRRSPISIAAKPCFLLATKGPYAYALDPAAGLWSRLPKPPYPSATILAASKGLVCLGNQVSECRTLAVLNMVSKEWKPLPSTKKVGLLHKVAMAVDTEAMAYVVVATGEDSMVWFAGRRRRGSSSSSGGSGDGSRESSGGSRCFSFAAPPAVRYELLTEVYDSASDQWREAGAPPPDAKFGSDPGVWCGGRFFCLTELPYGVAAFDLASGLWTELAPEMPPGMASPSLFCCGGRLFMVGVVRGEGEEDGVAGNDAEVYGASGYGDARNRDGSTEIGAAVGLNGNERRNVKEGEEVNVITLASACSSSSSIQVNLPPTRSWSWSGSLQLLASSPRAWLSTMTAWSWSLTTSSPSLLSLAPSSATPLPLPTPKLPFQASALPWPQTPAQPTLASPTTPLRQQPSFRPADYLASGRRRILIWSLSTDFKHWEVVDEMPPWVCEEFTTHLTGRTPLVCAGVGDDVCITSHNSPKAAILSMGSKAWRLAESDPVFPRNRDAHLLGFTMEPDTQCIP